MTAVNMSLAKKSEIDTFISHFISQLIPFCSLILSSDKKCNKRHYASTHSLKAVVNNLVEPRLKVAIRALCNY